MKSLAWIMLTTIGLALTVPAARAEQYKVDPVHSSVVFRIKHLGVSYCYGRFDKISGTFTLDEQNPAASTIDVVVESGSVDTGNASATPTCASRFFRRRQVSHDSLRVDQSHPAGEWALHRRRRPHVARRDQARDARDRSHGLGQGNDGRNSQRTGDEL